MASLVSRVQALGHMGLAVVAPALESTGTIVVAQRLSCFTAYGIFPHQGLNLRLLHRQADSLPLSHQGSPMFSTVLSQIVAIPWWSSS